MFIGRHFLCKRWGGQIDPLCSPTGIHLSPNMLNVLLALLKARLQTRCSGFPCRSSSGGTPRRTWYLLRVGGGKKSASVAATCPVSRSTGLCGRLPPVRAARQAPPPPPSSKSSHTGMPGLPPPPRDPGSIAARSAAGGFVLSSPASGGGVSRSR